MLNSQSDGQEKIPPSFLTHSPWTNQIQNAEWRIGGEGINLWCFVTKSPTEKRERESRGFEEGIRGNLG